MVAFRSAKVAFFVSFATQTALPIFFATYFLRDA
jgi:hypothetical protein